MTSGQWQRPAPSTSEGTHHGVLDALSRAMDTSQDPAWRFSVETQRLAGRSSIYVVRGERPGRPPARWVVKQPHPEWAQDDVDNPITAEDEFAALGRLDSHFRDLGVPFRVPTPVAFLPDVDALVMEHVDGRTIKDLLHYGSLRHPRTLLDGLAAAGTFLRHVHALEALPPVEVSLRHEAHQVLAVAEEKLHPLGLALPDRVRRRLEQFPEVEVSSPQVWLYGDFGPSNILLERDGSTVGLDMALTTVGQPEDDLVRFVALVSGMIRLAPEVVARPVGVVRRQLEDRLLQSYYRSDVRPPLFELRYLHQLCRRWCRLRELSEQHEPASRVRVKLPVIGAQMRLLMRDSERRLARSMGG